MKRALLLLALCTCAAQAQEVRVPPAVKEVLPNGLTIFFVDRESSPVVHLRLAARGGSALDPEGREGAASMMATLLRRGTAARSAVQIAAAVEATGGSLESAASVDYCVVKSEALARDADRMLELMADVVLRPAFPPEEIERERANALAGLDALLEDPGSVASRAFRTEAYGAHPYGRPADGTRRSLAEIERADIVRAHASAFVPSNCVLVVVGPVSASGLRERVRSAFSTWSGLRGAAPEVPPVPPFRGRTVVLVDIPEATQTQIVIGGTGPPMRHPDRAPLNVGATAFGGGFTSRLVRELRVNRSLTYGASGGFSANSAGGLFSVVTFTKNSTAGEAVEAALAETKEFREKGGTPGEVRTAVNAVCGTFARALQSPDVLAALVTDRELYGLPADQIEGYLRRTRAVTPEDVRRAAGAHFPADGDLLIVLAGPADSLAATAARFGPVSRKTLREVVR